MCNKTLNAQITDVETVLSLIIKRIAELQAYQSQLQEAIYQLNERKQWSSQLTEALMATESELEDLEL